MFSKLQIFVATFAVVVVASLFVSADVASFPPAPATVSLNEKLFNEIFAAAIPIVNEEAKRIVIPGANGKDFNYNDIRFSQFALGPVKVTFTAPAVINVDISSLSIAIPNTGFEIHKKILFIHAHCHGDFSMSAEDNSAEFSVRAERDAATSKIELAGAQVNLHLGKLHLDYKMSHGLCKILDVMKILLRVIDDIVKKTIEKKMPGIIEKALVSGLDKLFNKLPMKVTGNPSAQSGSLSLPIDLDSLLKSVHSPSSSLIVSPPMLHRPSKAVALSSSNKRGQELLLDTRDIAISLPQVSINTFLQSIHSLGKMDFNHTFSGNKITTKIFEVLLPNAYKACPDCPLNLGVDFTLAPSMTFQKQNATLTVRNLTLGINAINKNSTGGAPQSLFALNTLLVASVENFTITTAAAGNQTVKFDLQAEHIEVSTKSSQIGPIPTSVLNDIIQIVIPTFISIFNKDFKGLPLPSQGIKITHLLLDIEPTVFNAGVDIEL